MCVGGGQSMLKKYFLLFFVLKVFWILLVNYAKVQVGTFELWIHGQLFLLKPDLLVLKVGGDGLKKFWWSTLWATNDGVSYPANDLLLRAASKRKLRRFGYVVNYICDRDWCSPSPTELSNSHQYLCNCSKSSLFR